jgi:acyl CoA:acetate/3-ketoacid CoA transferase alpha subunit
MTHERNPERDAICSIAEAVLEIPDGASIAIAGPARRRRPLALVRELARQGRQPGRLLARTAGPESEILGVPLEIVAEGRPIDADVLIIHADAASSSGDVLLVDHPDVWYADRQLVATIGRVIASVEQLVSPETVAARPRDHLAGGEHVVAIVHAPFGAHPLAYPGRYPEDEGADLDLPDAPDHWTYLDRAGFAKLVRLATTYQGAQ